MGRSQSRHSSRPSSATNVRSPPPRPVRIVFAVGRGVLDHALFGSTTERVVRKAPCPVLICRVAEHEFVDEK
jgi:nucleotide-binding universal stress UspA family protein